LIRLSGVGQGHCCWHLQTLQKPKGSRKQNHSVRMEQETHLGEDLCSTSMRYTRVKTNLGNDIAESFLPRGRARFPLYLYSQNSGRITKTVKLVSFRP
jgi:hypothetical protein